MGALIKQTVNGKSYYYAIETKRVNGQPRVVKKQYLGRLEDIVRKVTEPPQPSSVKSREFGLTAALLGITDKLGFVRLVDDVVVKRNQGATVGQYMQIAAFNRCSAPTRQKQDRRVVRVDDLAESTKDRPETPYQPAVLGQHGHDYRRRSRRTAGSAG